MKCIYFTGTKCLARPINVNLVYKPTTDEQKTLCNYNNFSDCPRYRAYLEYLKAKSNSG